MRFICVTLITIGCMMYGISQDKFHENWFDPVIICSDNEFMWERFAPSESFPLIEIESCIKPYENLARVWFKFETLNSSNLAFVINPSNPNDDIDFALFRSRNGFPAEMVRCMSTGLNLDRSPESQFNCLGETGLSETETDNIEDTGCSAIKNNFLQSVRVDHKEEYFLLVTNYRSDEGFHIKWTGDAIFNDDLCHSPENQVLDILVLPNPSKEVIYYRLISKVNAKANVKLLSKSGIILENESISLLGGNNDFSIHVPNYSSGDYYLFVSTDGATVFSKIEIIK